MAKDSKTFEASMTRLEEIVSKLDSGAVSLEDALKLFEEGTALVCGCSKLLDEAELKVVKLIEGSDGAPVEEEFHDAE